MSRLREEPDSDDGSSPDEGVPGKFAGHRGNGKPMLVGIGYTQWEMCDGQLLASPGRCAPASRVYPTSHHWKLIAERFTFFAEYYGTESLLVSLAMGKVPKCPFPAEEVEKLKRDVIELASSSGFELDRKAGDRLDVPIDFRFLQQLLRLADDPETGLGEYSEGVKVGPGTRMPRLPTLYRPKKKWRLASQVDHLDYLEQATDPGEVWRRNYSTLEAFKQQILDLIYDQASRGQVLVLSEKEAKKRFPVVLRLVFAGGHQGGLPLGVRERQ